MKNKVVRLDETKLINLIKKVIRETYEGGEDIANEIWEEIITLQSGIKSKDRDEDFLEDAKMVLDTIKYRISKERKYKTITREVAYELMDYVMETEEMLDMSRAKQNMK